MLETTEKPAGAYLYLTQLWRRRENGEEWGMKEHPEVAWGGVEKLWFKALSDLEGAQEGFSLGAEYTQLHVRAIVCMLAC